MSGERSRRRRRRWKVKRERTKRSGCVITKRRDVAWRGEKEIQLTIPLKSYGDAARLGEM